MFLLFVWGCCNNLDYNNNLSISAAAALRLCFETESKIKQTKSNWFFSSWNDISLSEKGSYFWKLRIPERNSSFYLFSDILHSFCGVQLYCILRVNCFTISCLCVHHNIFNIMHDSPRHNFIFKWNYVGTAKTDINFPDRGCNVLQKRIFHWTLFVTLSNNIQNTFFIMSTTIYFRK